jgi:hypothetical protein
MMSHKTFKNMSKWVDRFLILLLIPTLTWADQKKNSSPQSRPRPAVRAAQPARRQQNVRRGPQQVRRAPQPRRQPYSSTHQLGNPMHGGRPTNVMHGTRGRLTSTGTRGKVTRMNPGPLRRGNGNKPVVRSRRGATQAVRLRGGKVATVRFRRNGRVATIRANGMTIKQPLRGPRTVIGKRNGRTLVSTGRNRGYVQRPYLVRNGVRYYQRTYVVNRVTYTRVYRGVYYRGHTYYDYVPARYYSSVYYGWAYNPWPAPVYWGPAAWGWVGSPWWAYYQPYWTPYPVYARASLWLTDYLIATNLQAAYQAQADANAAAPQAQANANTGSDQEQSGGNGPAGPAQSDSNAPGSPEPGSENGETAAPPPQPGTQQPAAQTQLSPEVKQAIATEVSAQLAAERAAAADPQQAQTSADKVPDALNPAKRIFVVSSSLDVVGADRGQQCSLTPGDVVMRLTDEPDSNQDVSASVSSSKGSDCPVGANVAIGVQDLQEMYNSFSQQVDSGLKALASNSGTKGLPPPPDKTTTSAVVPPPAPDADAAKELQFQELQANQTEAEVQQASGQG